MPPFALFCLLPLWEEDSTKFGTKVQQKMIHLSFKKKKITIIFLIFAPIKT